MESNPYVYLNSYIDTIDAMPMEIVRHFSLLDSTFSSKIAQFETLATKCIEFMNILECEAHARQTGDLEMLESYKKSEYRKNRQVLLNQIIESLPSNLTHLKEKVNLATKTADVVAKLVQKLDDNLTHFEDEEQSPWRITKNNNLDSMRLLAMAQINNTTNNNNVAGNVISNLDVTSQNPQSNTGSITQSTSKTRNGGGSNHEVSKSSNSKKTSESTPAKKRKHGKDSPPPGRSGTPSNRKEKHGGNNISKPSNNNNNNNNSNSNMGINNNTSNTSTSTHANNNFKKKETNTSKLKYQGDDNPDSNVDPNEPTYCYCNQVSYGEMVACDNDGCQREWFHLPCVGLVAPPKGKWYCKECLATVKRRR